LPDELRATPLSHPALAAVAKEDGALQHGTLGGGNHFVELQAEEGTDQLWLMIHSGSRAVGQAVKAHHVARASGRSAGMAVLDADSDDGWAYLHDQEWARRYADSNRRLMAECVIEIVRRLLNAQPDESSRIACDHNHVRREEHFGQSVLVHRKGAMPAGEGEVGAIPGSMGTLSFHVRGRGEAQSLRSSAHGAGRSLSRHAAREKFARAQLRAQMEGVWYDPRLEDALREESPRAYKDVRAVMRAQAQLVAVIRTLRPVLVYKGR
jgi:tRNA-splicing ligase RtcB